MAGARTDGRVERGNQTRRLVLGRTMAIASVEGLEGLSIGRVATELGLSKSGVFALFGSKEQMQLATIRAAKAVFREHVIRPAERIPPGLGRVRRLCEGFLAYSRSRVFPGGCFFTVVAAEFGGRGGPVHDAVALARTEWLTYICQVLDEARSAGDLRADLDVPQLAFELKALMETANADSTLHRDDAGYDRAAVAIAARLRATAAEPPALADRVGG
ncbi:TetR/AcrR family transcriptional regulator [Streptomyces sp. NBC_01803]|uniref:TetR/AcrR family transcriptional regulator n=1 Tax=Streptomyces sp. NBC_01803 TaxID=2975946 RepID=UPI002DD9F47B|nr:TetR family transcriptional regulator [Streptomyces sp. NBC_01803]WSA42899.1 TetR family transcriptional regulator [Streptomyces sp. NBC_01803]